MGDPARVACGEFSSFVLLNMRCIVPVHQRPPDAADLGPTSLFLSHFMARVSQGGAPGGRRRGPRHFHGPPAAGSSEQHQPTQGRTASLACMARAGYRRQWTESRAKHLTQMGGLPASLAVLSYTQLIRYCVDEASNTAWAQGAGCCFRVSID